MPGPDDAVRYHRLQLVLGLGGFLLTVVYLVIVLAAGWSAQLTLIASVITDTWWVQVAVVAV